MIDIRKLTAAEYDVLALALYEYVSGMEDHEADCDGELDPLARQRLTTATRLRDELDAARQALADTPR